MGRTITREKNCYCHTCQKEFHHLGIMNHRKAHRVRKEDCRISFTHGETFAYKYSES